MVAGKYFDEENPVFTIKDNVIIGDNPKYVSKEGLAEELLNCLSKKPEFVAQIDVQTGESLTFKQIKDRSIRCALWLKKHGIGKNDVVCVSTPNQINDFIPCLSTLYVGAIFNPWYHILTPAIARYFFDMMKPKVMFACEESIDLLAEVANEANINCKFVAYKNHPIFPSLQDIMDEQTQIEVDNFRHVEPVDARKQAAVIFFSSGTTGTQKGTVLSYDTVQKNRHEQMCLHENINIMYYSSLSWITGTNFSIINIQLGYTRIIHSEPDPEDTCQVIEKYKVNWIFLTPSVLTQFCKQKIFDKYKMPSLKVLMTGGSRCTKTILEEAQKKLPHVFINNSYGMTELGGLTLWKCITRRKNIDAIGFVVQNMQIKVADMITGKALGPNQTGELRCKSDNLMLGYYNKPQETKEMYDNEGWMRTGDLGYYDEDGEFMIVDRIKQVIISQNHHISPSQIEEILLRHPEVDDAAVVPVPHSIDVERPLAFVVKVPGGKVTAEELMQLPTTFNEVFALTGGVIFVDKIPYTSTGKKCLRDLKDMAKAYAK